MAKKDYPVTTGIRKLREHVVGGISPFGTRTNLPVYIERSICQLSRIYINAGKRGFLVEVSPTAIRDYLNATEVSVAAS